MMLVPVMGVDLYELANNHMWRAPFGFTNWITSVLGFMRLPHEGRAGDELDWIHYTFENYYTLLNCGFNLRPTAGTANGVHPVPLGFGRVYVHIDGSFCSAKWFQGLGQGRSFVTTGPMLLAKVDNQLPGEKFACAHRRTRRVAITGKILSQAPVNAAEVILNGAIVAHLKGTPKRNSDGAYELKFRGNVDITRTSWLALRCWESRAEGRVRFAHTAPWFFEVKGEPLHPRREQIEFLIKRVRDQIDRSAHVLPPEALAEYYQALSRFEAVADKSGR